MTVFSLPLPLTMKNKGCEDGAPYLQFPSNYSGGEVTSLSRSHTACLALGSGFGCIFSFF